MGDIEPTPDERVAAFLVRLERLDGEDLGRLSLPDPYASERAGILRTVDAAAQGAGRAELLETARHLARERVERAYAGRMYEPTWIGLNWGRSTGTARDRAVVVAAVEDAAASAVVCDLVDPEAFDWLNEPFEALAALAGTAGPTESLTRPGRVGLVAAAVFLSCVFLALASLAVLVDAVWLAVIGTVAVAGLLVLARTRHTSERGVRPPT